MICSKCDKKFDYQYEYRKHIKEEHPLICGSCGQEFGNIEEVLEHEKTCDDEKEIEKKPKKNSRKKGRKIKK